MPESNRSFSDEDTHFRLVRSQTPVTVDGFKINEPTGEIECLECGASAGAPEYIPHDGNCDQQGVTSEWYDSVH